MCVLERWKRGCGSLIPTCCYSLLACGRFPSGLAKLAGGLPWFCGKCDDGEQVSKHIFTKDARVGVVSVAYISAQLYAGGSPEESRGGFCVCTHYLANTLLEDEDFTIKYMFMMSECSLQQAVLFCRYNFVLLFLHSS